MASTFRTDWLPNAAGIYVPPGYQSEAERRAEERREREERRFFAADEKVGKYYTAFGIYGHASVTGGMEKPRDTPTFMALRSLYEKSPIDKMIVLARLHQMRFVSERALIPEKETGWRVMHVRAADPNFENTEDIERRCREMEAVIANVNRSVVPGGFRAFLQMMTEDELVYDRKVMIIARDMLGRPAAYWPVDPTCYSADTEVLTEAGWKRFDQVDLATDRFATRNQQTHALEYQQAFYFHEAEKNEDLYHFSSRSVDILTTANHRMLVTKLPEELGGGHRRQNPAEVFVSAEDLYRYSRTSQAEQAIPATSHWDAPDLDVFTLPAVSPQARAVVMSGDDYAAFMGMYLAEGCVVAAGTPKRDVISITQQESSKGFGAFRELLRRVLGREPSYNGKDFYFKHETLSRYLRQFGKAHEKYVPDEVQRLSARQLGIFWAYYLLGDGRFHKDGSVSAVTVSKRLADGLQVVAQKLGISLAIAASQPRGDSRLADGRVIREANKRTRYTLYARYSSHHRFNVEKVPYRGKVYCVSVPNEVLYVRRNGKASWCGNTVKPRIEVLAPWMVKNGVKNPQVAAERMSLELYERGQRDANGNPIDLTKAAYIQEIEGQIVGAWTEDEISVDITHQPNAVDHYFYGRSIFEESLEWTAAFVAAFRYNATWFNSKIPENLLYLAGDVAPDGYDSFKKQFFGQGTSNDPYHRMAVITGDKDFNVQVFPMRQTMREMAFPAWIRLLIAGKCACYRMDPRIINFDVATGNDVNLWKTSSREAQLTLAEEQGFHTLIKNMESWLNRVIVQPRYDDLVVRWVGLDRASEPDRVALLAQKMQWSTFDEIRAETGNLPPLAVLGYPELGRMPANPQLLQYMTYFDQKRMLYAQMEQEQRAQQYAQAGGGGLRPDESDDANAPAAGGTPRPGDRPVSAGDVQRQAAGMADSARKAFGTSSLLQRRRKSGTVTSQAMRKAKTKEAPWDGSLSDDDLFSLPRALRERILRERQEGYRQELEQALALGWRSDPYGRKR
jgi:hypothetical protein